VSCAAVKESAKRAKAINAAAKRKAERQQEQEQKQEQQRQQQQQQQHQQQQQRERERERERERFVSAPTGLSMDASLFNRLDKVLDKLTDIGSSSSSAPSAFGTAASNVVSVDVLKLVQNGLLQSQHQGNQGLAIVVAAMCQNANTPAVKRAADDMEKHVRETKRRALQAELAALDSEE
jgi:hypothetical protein